MSWYEPSTWSVSVVMDEYCGTRFWRMFALRFCQLGLNCDLVDACGLTNLGTPGHGPRSKPLQLKPVNAA